jgi:hypothetical protein
LHQAQNVPKIIHAINKVVNISLTPAPPFQTAAFLDVLGDGAAEAELWIGLVGEVDECTDEGKDELAMDVMEYDNEVLGLATAQNCWERFSAVINSEGQWAVRQLTMDEMKLRLPGLRHKGHRVQNFDALRRHMFTWYRNSSLLRCLCSSRLKWQWPDNPLLDTTFI